MTTYTASCRCGQIRAAVTGEPVRASVCHCLDCQKRSGSAFAAQVRFPAEQVTIEGQSQSYAATSDSGAVTDFHFCPTCGGAAYYVHRDAPQTIAIPLGAFDHPRAFTPAFSMFESRKHDWVVISGENVEHD